jgi:hypothetical protein
VQGNRPARQARSQHGRQPRDQHGADRRGGHELGRPVRQVVVDVVASEGEPGDARADHEERRRDQQHAQDQLDREGKERHEPPDEEPEPRDGRPQRAALLPAKRVGHQRDIEHGGDDGQADQRQRAGEPGRREQEPRDVLVGHGALARDGERRGQHHAGHRHEDPGRQQADRQMNEDERPQKRPRGAVACDHVTEDRHLAFSDAPLRWPHPLDASRRSASGHRATSRAAAPDRRRRAGDSIRAFRVRIC